MAARTGQTSDDYAHLHKYLSQEQLHLTALLMYVGLQHGLTPQQIIALPDEVKELKPLWKVKSNSVRKYDFGRF